MEALKIIKERRSIRDYKTDPLSKEIIDKLVEALIWAPSAGNLQSRKFYFVFNEKIKKELAEAAFGQDFIAQAPLVVVGCTDDKIVWRYGERGKNLYSICDVSASIQNMILVAEENNLGTCWIGAFDEDEVAKILNLPKPSTGTKLGTRPVLHRPAPSERGGAGAGNLRPIVIVPVGYPAERPSPPPRVSKNEAIKEIK